MRTQPHSRRHLAALLSGGTALIQPGPALVAHRAFQVGTILRVLAAACVDVSRPVSCCLGPHVVVGHPVGQRLGSAHAQGDLLPLRVAIGADVDGCHGVPVSGVHPVDVDRPVCSIDLISHDLHPLSALATSIAPCTHSC